MRWSMLAVVLVTACFRSHEVVCTDGRTCPAQTTCVEIEASQLPVCARDEDVAACAGADVFASCMLQEGATGSCYTTDVGLVCQPNGCGNSIQDPGEVCDDGNSITGDTCSYSCSSDESCGNGLVDPIVLVGDVPMLNEVCDDANLLGRDGCTSGCQLEAPRWQALEVGVGPTVSEHAMTYDPIRRRVVLFGGQEDGSSLSAEVWEWDGAGWMHRATTVGPSARSGHAVAYEASSHQLIAFGGSSGFQGLTDTWRWDGETWRSLSPATSPGPHRRFGSAYDTRRHRLVIFGGEQGAADTWAWDGTTWLNLPTPPALAQGGRVFPAMAYDPGRDRIVLAGGIAIIGEPRTTWELADSTWVQVADATATPADLGGATMAYDPIGKRMIVYGGGDDVGSTPLARTLAWDGRQWSDLGDATPGPLRRAAAATDPVRGQIVLHGGTVTGCALGCVGSNATWIWDGARWSAPPPPVAPGTRSHMAAAFDQDRQTLVMFGGFDGSGVRGDTWELTDGHWTNVASTGPQPRSDAGMAYDAAHHQIVMFGGRVVTVATPTTWLWDGVSWTQATPATSPPPRAEARLAYDAERQRVVMFGGKGQLEDTWEWDGTTWLEH
ncbi:MAG: hypothetical protein NT062_11300, partial [Proteobacteria bacterium]|nr:hypothetical protein [Pseudomonadota bacterium]